MTFIRFPVILLFSTIVKKYENKKQFDLHYWESTTIKINIRRKKETSYPWVNNQSFFEILINNAHGFKIIKKKKINLSTYEQQMKDTLFCFH